jgi:O-antigen ligase
MLFAIAGLAVTWRECKAIMYVISSAAVVNLVSARLFAAESTQQRLSLEFSSIANANDFAAHLLLVLPFLLWTALNSRSGLLRIGAMLGVGWGLYLILRTGSRGAVVGLGLDVLVVLIWGTARQRLALFTLGPIALAAILALTPREALRRSVSFSGGADAVSSEAQESSEARRYLLQKSVEYALHHPLFGVGLGMFANYEGIQSVSSGRTGAWHVTHNSFTQAACECGIPAMLLFMAGISSTLILVNATWRDARLRNCEDIQTAAFCMMLAIVGFCAAMTFLSLAYTFYLPAMGGLAISIDCAARRTFAVRDRRRMLLTAVAGGVAPPPASPDKRPLA